MTLCLSSIPVGVAGESHEPPSPVLKSMEKRNFEEFINSEDLPTFRRHLQELEVKPLQEHWSQPYRVQIASQFYFVQSRSKLMKKYVRLSSNISKLLYS